MDTILIIDDSHDYRANLMEILEFENYMTLGAENGQIGLDVIRQHLPNLIVCDIEMPIMNGIEVLKTVKADPLLAKIPFLIVSGSIDNLKRYAPHDLAAQAYLTKPMDISTFLFTIGGFLNVETSANSGTMLI